MNIRYSYTANTSNTKPGWLLRGYTGHEHLPEFNLINMNGRMYDPLIARMLSPDNYVQSASSTQAYNRYSYAYNNPLKYTDPSGDWFGIDDAIVAGSGFAFGYLSHGIKTGDWKWSSVAAGGIGALTAWVGFNTFGAGLAASQYIANMGINTIASTILPSVNVPIGKNTSISVSPTFGFGTGGFGVGANVGVSYQVDLGRGFYANLGIDAGVGSVDGGEFRLGGGAEIGHGHVALGIYSTYYGAANGSSQRVGGASLAIGDFKVRYENDWFFGLPTGDGGDRYRTAAAQISYGDFFVGVNLYTGAPQERNGQRLTDQGWVNKEDLNSSMCYEESSTPRLGAIYGGYKNYRIGYNSEMLRYNIQNHLVHDKVNSPYFNFVWYNQSNFYYRQQTNFRYSLW